jgi:Flp pilus assembly protein TadG
MRSTTVNQRLTSRERGNAILEFALAAPVLLLILAGAFQFGYSFFLYNRLISTVHAGARYASLRTYDSATSTPSSAFLTEVRNLVVYGDPAGGDTPVVPALRPEHVRITASMNNSTPVSITVAITGFEADVVFTKFRFIERPSATFAFAGRSSRSM